MNFYKYGTIFLACAVVLFAVFFLDKKQLAVIVNLILALAVIAIALILYFLPALNAHSNKHHNKSAIFVLNLFLGWTFLGWVIALVWSFTKK